MTMIRILTFTLSMYWSAFFAYQSLALAGTVVPGKFAATAGLPGLAGGAFASPAVALIMSIAFALSGAMFLWSAFGSILLSLGQTGHFRDIAARAVALSVAAITLAFALLAHTMTAELIQAFALYIAGLAGSYAAMAAERIVESDADPENDRAVSARVMALNAAHNSLLSRFSGRGGYPTGENR